MQNSIYFTIGLWLFFLLFNIEKVNGQDLKIELGPGDISANDIFTITISIENGKITEYDKFPEIPGFIKSGTSSSSATNIINGTRTSYHSIIQNYIPSGEGEYTLKPFYMTINGEIYSSPGKKISVGPAMQSRRHNDPLNYDPFEEFFGSREEQEFVEVEDDAFFALTTDKDQVYVGEGINVVLAFYISEKNEAPLHFYDVGRQLSEILKNLKPANCWEENFNIDNINGTRVIINDKHYQQYKIYQASFFPLNNNPVEFPSLGLQMIKYKVARKQHFFGQNKKEDYKTYYSRPKSVKVNELPPHPAKDQVSVGIFKISEKISDMNLSTGESFTYDFNIIGEGNISNLPPPVVPAEKNIEFYAPSSVSNLKKTGNKISGNKAFSYFGIPNEPGNYDLKKFFNWIY
ncbi:MAG: BatD family protein, partial [Bacteroidota bacterium]|nr:BatD family protein [Bacteroidota bacterium]